MISAGDGSLDNLIKTRLDLSLKTRLDLALDIANALNYLHRLNVVHRDLKPGNIVLDDNMRPKITDFGLAMKKSATMTSFRGSEMGTPAFMVKLLAITIGTRMLWFDPTFFNIIARRCVCPPLVSLSNYQDTRGWIANA